jgi:outer membrane lipoprotein-sorting protein
MARHFRFLATASVSALLALGTAVAFAQDAKKGPTPSNPVGAGAGWNANIAQGGGITLDAKQTELVKRVSTYFNDLAQLRGSFVQTSADNKRMRGKFFVKKPGRFRFDYALPSKQVILSDGNLLAIQDHDLGNEDVVELDNTPFRILLRKDVDLLRDARIGEVQEADDVIVLTLQDKSPDAPGRIKLIMVKKPPGLELKEWITTDAQGLDTRIELTEVNRTDPVDDALFKRQPMKKPQ